MFCPKCRAEYRDGFTTCSDCHLELVVELPEEPEPQYVHYTELLGTYNPADIVFLKSLLESEGIQFFFKGETFMHVRPLADPVRLMVRQDQAAEAMALIKDVKLAVAGVNLDKRKTETDSIE